MVTGECECSEGVGGRECDFCLHGYFNYSPTDGCTRESRRKREREREMIGERERERERERESEKFLIFSSTACDCGVGSVNGSCTSTGQCYCQPGVEGAKCDLCQPFTFDLSPSGCESCGGCEQNLRVDLEREEEILANITEQEELVMRLSEVDQEGLGKVEEVADLIGQDLAEIGERLDQTQTEIVSVNESYIVTREIVSTIEERVSGSSICDLVFITLKH